MAGTAVALAAALVARALVSSSERCIGCDDPVGHVHHA
jgi:hypothetical protein